MRKLFALLMGVVIICSNGAISNASDLGEDKTFNLIEYCETHEINSEGQLEAVLCQYAGITDPQESNGDVDQNTEVSFDLEIDYENQMVITTTVYETSNIRSTKSGHAEKKYRNAFGFEVFTVRVDGSFNYNGTTSSTSSATGTFTPAALSGWSSTPSTGTGKSGGKAYARAYGTATNLTESQSYSVYLYCDKNGNLSSS